MNTKATERILQLTRDWQKEHPDCTYTDAMKAVTRQEQHKDLGESHRGIIFEPSSEPEPVPVTPAPTSDPAVLDLSQRYRSREDIMRMTGSDLQKYRAAFNSGPR